MAIQLPRYVIVDMEGLTPYSQSRPLQSKRHESETDDDFDQRIWREHIHLDEDGDVVIPIKSLLGSLVESAKLLSKGGNLKKKGNATWSENIVGGVSMLKAPKLVAPEVRSERFYCHVNGQRGTGKRVWRTFPMWDSWTSTAEYVVFDETITTAVLEECMHKAGLLKGIGRYRPACEGHNGRFHITEIKWTQG